LTSTSSQPDPEHTPEPFAVQVPIGERIVEIGVSEFKGKMYFGARVMYQNSVTSELRHSRNGISIPFFDAPDLVRAMINVLDEAGILPEDVVHGD